MLLVPFIFSYIRIRGSKTLSRSYQYIAADSSFVAEIKILEFADVLAPLPSLPSLVYGAVTDAHASELTVSPLNNPEVKASGLAEVPLGKAAKIVLVRNGEDTFLRLRLVVDGAWRFVTPPLALAPPVIAGVVEEDQHEGRGFPVVWSAPLG